MVPVGHPVLPSPEHVCPLVFQALPLQGITLFITNIEFSKNKCEFFRDVKTLLTHTRLVQSVALHSRRLVCRIAGIGGKNIH